MIEIRQAESKAEIAEAKALLLEYANALDFDLCFQRFDAELAGLPGDYAPPSGRLFLAYVDGAPAASIALHGWSDAKYPTPAGWNVCEMKRLFVRPQFRGHKLAHQLIDRLIAEAREIGYTHMRLDTVVGTMDAAIALYREYGFYEIAAYRPNPQPRVLYFELKL
jgi:putative acetyltransferase